MYWFSLYLLQEHIQIYLEDKIFSKPFNLLRQKKDPLEEPRSSTAQKSSVCRCFLPNLTGLDSDFLHSTWTHLKSLMSLTTQLPFWGRIRKEGDSVSAPLRPVGSLQPALQHWRQHPCWLTSYSLGVLPFRIPLLG